MELMNRLTKLLALNRGAARSYRVESGPDDATIYLYDVIGGGFFDEGISAKAFARDLAQITAPVVHLRINSPGGDVFEGRAMVAAIKAHPSKVVAHIDGLAASAASFLAMHADEVEITDGAFVMIHNGWAMAVGDKHTMLDTAGLLEKVDASIVDDYASRVVGADREQIVAWMNAETWFTAAEAVAHGFADRIVENAKPKAMWNLSAYEHAPEELTPEEIPPEEPTPDHDALHAERLRRFALIEPCPA